MTRPTFDTLGYVAMGSEHSRAAGRDLAGINIVWSDLTPFQQGYVEALFATAKEMNFAHWGAPLTFSMLSPEALDRIMADCASMENIAGGVGISKLDEAKGRNFWNGRKAGGYGLAPVVATAFPPLTPFLSEDGKIHLREAQS